MKDFELSQTYTQDLSIKAESMESAKIIADQNSKEKALLGLKLQSQVLYESIRLDEEVKPKKQSNKIPKVKYPKIYVLQMGWSCNDEFDKLTTIGAYTDREYALDAFRKELEKLRTGKDSWESAAMEKEDGYSIETASDYFSICPEGRYIEQHTDLFISEVDLFH